jgi:phospholipid/cholesterol/gamma-HCH transport system ATP-binding protein
MVPMSASTSSLVQLSNVRIDRSGRTILRDVSLQVPKGSITARAGSVRQRQVDCWRH